VAVDVDERATVVARENSQRNDVDERIHVICGEGLGAVKGKYDLIVSNISTKIILSMIPDFRYYLNDDGRLIVSGILGREVPEARNRLENSGFMMLETRCDEEWVGIVAGEAGRYRFFLRTPMHKCHECLPLLEFPLIKGPSSEFPLKKAVRGRFLRQKQEANGANAGYRWNSPLAKAAPPNSPLKKGDKGGCFLCCLNPVIMSFQPEDAQKPTPSLPVTFSHKLKSSYL